MSIQLINNSRRDADYSVCYNGVILHILQVYVEDRFDNYYMNFGGTWIVIDSDDYIAIRDALLLMEEDYRASLSDMDSWDNHCE